MSTDDVYEIFRGPCECGAGEFVVIESEPDHPFAKASQRSWDTDITCAQCKRDFVLLHRRPQFLVVLKTEIEKARAAAAAKSKQQETFMASPKVAELKGQLIGRLASIRAKAAVFREVRDAGFFIMAPSTFVAKYSGAEAWVNENFHRPSDVVAALRLLGRASDPLAVQAAQFAQLNPTASFSVIRTLPIQAG